MTINSNISQEDYINFNIDHFHKIRPLKFSNFVLRFLLPLGIFAFCTLFNINQIILAIVGGYAVVWMIFFNKFMKKGRRNSTLKFIKKGKANNFIGKQKVVLADDRMEVTNTSFTSKIDYQAVEGIFFGSNIYYVYVGNTKAVLVPYSAFPGEKQRQEFFDIMYKKTGFTIKNI